MKIKVLDDTGAAVGTRSLEDVDPYDKFTKDFFFHGGSFLIGASRVRDHNTLAEIKGTLCSV